MDELDMAAILEEEQRQVAINKVRAITEPVYEGLDCSDCGEPIGAERKAKVPYARRCITCQTLVETKR